MHRSEFPQVGKVGQRFGSRKPATVAALPNLPNLPNLPLVHVCVCVPACVQTPAHRYAHTRARSRAPIPHNRLGRLGRLGRGRAGAGFRAPNLCPTFPTSGEIMPFDLDRFRRQYPDAMAELRDTEGWTRADLDDADAAVAAAYKRNDPHELDCWANWIAMYARRRRTRLADADDARLVRVVPLITPEELDQLQRSRATPAAPTPYRGRNPR